MNTLVTKIKGKLGDNGVPEKEKQAGVCLLLRKSQTGKLFDILYMERADIPGDHWAGQIGFPGGKRDETDTDIQFTVEREFLEEMGDSISIKAKPLGRLNSLQGRKAGALMDFTIHPFVYIATEQMSFEPDPMEVGDYHWIPIEEILNPSNQTSFELDYKNGRVVLPGISFPNNKTLWGLTYMFTKDFFGRLGDIEEILELHNELSNTDYLAHMIDYPG